MKIQTGLYQQRIQRFLLLYASHTLINHSSSSISESGDASTLPIDLVGLHSKSCLSMLVLRQYLGLDDFYGSSAISFWLFDL